MEAFSFHVNLPKAWTDLSDGQLRFLCAQLARKASAVDMQTRCFFKWAKLDIIDRQNDGFFIVRHRASWRKHTDFLLSARQVQPAVDTLKWVATPSTVPVCIKRIGHHRALTADFQKVPFRFFIYTNNLFQGFLQTKQPEMLRLMAEVLYQADGIRPSQPELVSIFYWVTSLKTMFAHRFHHFFQPIDSLHENLLQQPMEQLLQESMDAQIRALTGGDITKEEEILDMDTWRALTELDAKARDYEDLKKAYR